MSELRVVVIDRWPYWPGDSVINAEESGSKVIDSEGRVVPLEITGGGGMWVVTSPEGEMYVEVAGDMRSAVQEAS